MTVAFIIKLPLLYRLHFITIFHFTYISTTGQYLRIDILI